MPNFAQLNNVEHANLRVKRERNADLGDAVMHVPVFPVELREVQAIYPIAFIKEAKSGLFRPCALFGLQDGENLYLNGDGWDAAYIPMAMQMHPFVIGINQSATGEQGLEVHVDLDHPRVSQEDGEPLFLEHGGQTEYLQSVATLLGQIHEAEQSTSSFSALLNELELVEPFTLEVTLNNGESGRLEGYYTIAEEKLYALDADGLDRRRNQVFSNPCS